MPALICKASGQSGDSRPNQFYDLVSLDQFNKRIQFCLISCQLDHHRRISYIHNLGTEYIYHCINGRSLFFPRLYFHKNQFTAHRCLSCKLFYRLNIF